MTVMPLPPAERAALRRLCRLDPRLAAIERAAGPLHWRMRNPGFATMLSAIVGQQISNAAANAIRARLEAAMPCGTPAGLLRLSEAELRAVGFSGPKIRYARGLAEAMASGAIDLDAIGRLPDEAAIAAISALQGFGRWSAEVYLLFAHRRRDVFPAADLALAAAAQHLLGLAERPKEQPFRALAESWAPYRGLAARLLWHHWRYVTQRPADAA
jgi:DNA-3-methyladenine glycosylase II